MISWMPYAVVSMWTAYGDISMLPIRLTVGAVLLAKTSTVVNPVIYFLLSNKFRPLLKRSLNCRRVQLVIFKQRRRKNADINKAVTIPLVPVTSTPRHESNPIQQSGESPSISESNTQKLLENCQTVDLWWNKFSLHYSFTCFNTIRQRNKRQTYLIYLFNTQGL